jgi:two-component system sensor histidine kinase PilS (NtrC family)
MPKDETLSANRLRNRLLWLDALRLVIALLVLGAILLQRRGGKQFFSRDPVEAYYIIVAAAIIGIFYLALLGSAKIRNIRSHASLQIGIDVILESLLVYFTGGVDSIFAYLFFASILAAALLSSTRMALLLASCATILLSSITILYFFYGHANLALPYFAKPNVPLEATHSGNLEFLLAYLFFFSLSLHLVAFLSGRLAAELGRTRIVNEEILENIAGGVIAVDRDGMVAFINAQAKRMLTMSPSRKGVGRHISTMFAGRDAGSPHVREDIPLPQVARWHLALECRQDGSPPCMENPWKPLLDALVSNTAANCTIETVDSAGKIVSIEMVTTQLRDGEGHLRGTIAFLNDVSLVRDMARARAHIESLRMVAKFSAGMAHEIRTPLAALHGCVQELAETYTPPTPAGQRLLDIVIKESTRLNRIVSDFLEFAKERPLEPSRQDVRGLAEEVVILLQRTELAAAVEFSLEVPADLVWSVDAEQMKQVLVNLVQNALEAVATRSAKGEQDRPCISLRSWRARGTDGGERVFLEVADNGPGIAAGDAERIFEPFYTTKPGGTGMGLAIASRICEAHGGSIEVRSSADTRTVFTVILPAH